MSQIIHLREEPVEHNDNGIRDILEAIENNGGVIETVSNIDAAKELFKDKEENRPMVLATGRMLVGPEGYKVVLGAAAIDYIRKGGTVIVVWPLDFPAYDLDAFFKMSGLPWRVTASGDWYKTDHVLNQNFPHFSTNRFADYEMKCGLLDNVRSEDSLYVRDAVGLRAQLENASPDLWQDGVASAYAKIKDGIFGYVGDDGENKESIEVVLAMLGLF
ncbi:hypothetical protein CLAFUW4_09421 [Fulvia fulva]|uniref:Uncharacterized protein n=1 Tax=Passalora fulva TaxID=5499 RepID=A0A9Q8UTP0_PASFU|nr:uncharacterized protein CLAFUR5_09518 [Fulvia fulva]KAK4614035.1 hypothetical protein CLAFUR4_09427 [Fulvia fulva]KAK4615125.1 hypothetical protein CLAFUR0_09418 [Fulvia fulva]UJO22028.1 hypothetical protein CLAFUR5_09518 [Fulvia fulva]WPV20478.1 hypothetical protein CLAFUW4_09421 [Fulvia fulva]WPV35462.1 hypothetical protein CLAFUW7_09422 [Fulvia fulva]